MVVVDTNILAYLLLEGTQSTAARALLDKDADWRSEPFILIELSNVLATAIRVRGVSLASASTTLAHGRRVIGPGMHHVIDADALALAARFRVTAYDARFLAVARVLSTRLVTEDAKLRKAASELTCLLADALAS